MAYTITDRKFVSRKGDKHLDRVEAVLDTKADLEALGADYAPGSVAMVADAGAPVYVMNASGEWKEI